MTEVAPVSSGDAEENKRQHSGAAGRIRRGLAANIGGMGVTLVIQLVSVPVLLTAWGVPTYGEWLVLSAVPTYVALSDLSFSSVAGNSMVMLEAQGNRTDAVALGRRLWSIVTVMTGIASSPRSRSRSSSVGPSVAELRSLRRTPRSFSSRSSYRSLSATSTACSTRGTGPWDGIRSAPPSASSGGSSSSVP